MGLFDFFSTGGKRLSRVKLERLLREIGSLSAPEREFVKGLFDQYESGGISKMEVERAVRELKFDSTDPISPAEAEAIRKKLLDNL